MTLHKKSFLLPTFLIISIVIFSLLSLYDFYVARITLSQTRPSATPTISFLPPSSAKAGNAVELTWHIDTPTPRQINQTTIYFDSESSPSALTAQDSPQAVNYFNSLPDYQIGDFSSPGTFSAVLSIPLNLPQIFVRAYARIDEGHYWSEEFKIEIQQ